MNVLVIVLQLVVLLVVVLLHVAYATYFERKVIGHMQMRMGPTRVGWLGLLQPIADGIKSFFKEDIIPSAADKPIFMLAPIICLVPVPAPARGQPSMANRPVMLALASSLARIVNRTWALVASSPTGRVSKGRAWTVWT